MLQHLVDLFLSLVLIITQFLFSFACLSCDYNQNNGKNQGISIFLAQGTHHGISLLLHHEVELFQSLVLIIIIAIPFSIYQISE